MRTRFEDGRIITVWSYSQLASVFEVKPKVARRELAKYLKKNDPADAMWARADDGEYTVLLSTKDAEAFIRNKLAKYIPEDFMEHTIGLMIDYDADDVSAPI